MDDRGWSHSKHRSIRLDGAGREFCQLPTAHIFAEFGRKCRDCGNIWSRLERFLKVGIGRMRGGERRSYCWQSAGLYGDWTLYIPHAQADEEGIDASAREAQENIMGV